MNEIQVQVQTEAVAIATTNRIPNSNSSSKHNNLKLSESCAGRQKVRWTEAQERAFVEAVKKYGEGKWMIILADKDMSYEFRDKTAMQLKDKWRNIKIKIIQSSREKKMGKEGRVVKRPIPIGGGIEVPPSVEASGSENEREEDENTMKKVMSKIKLPGMTGYRKRPLVELLSDTEDESTTSDSDSSNDNMFLVPKRQVRHKKKENKESMKQQYLDQQKKIQTINDDLSVLKGKIEDVTNDLEQCANVLPVRKIHEKALHIQNEINRFSLVFELRERNVEDTENENENLINFASNNHQAVDKVSLENNNRTGTGSNTEINSKNELEKNDEDNNFIFSPKTRGQKNAAALKANEAKTSEHKTRRSSIGFLGYIFPGMVESNIRRTPRTRAEKQKAAQQGNKTNISSGNDFNGPVEVDTSRRRGKREK